jgi:hypothetical protein
MMRIHRKDVSDDEVKQAMVGHINEMFKHVRPRVVVELKDDKDKTDRKKRSKKARGLISRDEKELLEDVFEHPNLGVKARSDRLGWSDYKMNKVKRLVVDRGLAESYKVNLGRRSGGETTLIGLTEAGYKFLRKEPVVRPLNVDWPHWWWQTNIWGYHSRRGEEAEIEMCMGGVRADIGLKVGSEVVAVEVEMSTKNAVQNIVNDLEAGFDRVVSCCKDKKTAKAVKKSLEATKNYEAIKDMVEVKVLTELQLVKELYNKKQ